MSISESSVDRCHFPLGLLLHIISTTWSLPLTERERVGIMTSWLLVSKHWNRLTAQVVFKNVHVPNETYYHWHRKFIQEGSPIFDEEMRYHARTNCYSITFACEYRVKLPSHRYPRYDSVPYLREGHLDIFTGLCDVGVKYINSDFCDLDRDWWVYFVPDQAAAVFPNLATVWLDGEKVQTLISEPVDADAFRKFRALPESGPEREEGIDAFALNLLRILLAPEPEKSWEDRCEQTLKVLVMEAAEEFAKETGRTLSAGSSRRESCYMCDSWPEVVAMLEMVAGWYGYSGVIDSSMSKHIRRRTVKDYRTVGTNCMHASHPILLTSDATLWLEDRREAGT
ncbi:hypothetical protein BDQ12DRAFT_667193 [Crucibulum laeve]|uniref:Uncharacterized protein n=1 Tax=Crucibulum laeve TaxID=68775 RepID=A0A5C3LZE4_9AGAR|nr:hypothetical protein BDQ12DRAFT_667193 [Crucibulum laeve]